MNSPLTTEQLYRIHRKHVKSLHEVSEWFWGMLKRDPITHCWIWQGSTDTHGYGRFKAAGQKWLTHRAALFLVRGPSPLDGLHRCDNPACASPFHLYYGTHKQNMDEMQARGRKAILTGTQCPNARFTENDIAMIRASKATLALLAIMFGTTRQYIWNIKHRRCWTHVYP